ncbi:MAG: RNA polymerase sigma factor [Myxococcales bacterium]
MTLEEQAKRALDGDAEALETLVRAIRDDIYNLALRMLWHPEDAREATQEILVKVLTHLDSFQGRSAFKTWVYRIASNFLLNTRKRRAEHEEATFELFARSLSQGSADASGISEPERAVLVEEVKVGCTHAMLLCLDRDHRLAYLLGELFGLPGDEAAAVLEVEPATFRKRLSRARERLGNFVEGNCGLANPASSCRCSRRIKQATADGHLDPAHLLFAHHPRAAELVGPPKAEMESLARAAELFRANPRYAAPETLGRELRALLESRKLRILQ